MVNQLYSVIDATKCCPVTLLHGKKKFKNVTVATVVTTDTRFAHIKCTYTYLAQLESRRARCQPFGPDESTSQRV